MSRDALLARLARLGPDDRAWLLGELPPEMRRKLMDGLDDEEPTPAAPAIESPKGFEALDPQGVAAVLEAEPAWLVSAATRGCEAKWRERFLHHLSARRRHDVELADRNGGALNARAAGLVLAACRERMTDLPATAGAPRGGFAAMVDQFRSRFA